VLVICFYLHDWEHDCALGFLVFLSSRPSDAILLRPLQVRQCPKRRQTMLFSATMTEQVSNLINLSLNSPVRLSADPSTKRPISLSEEYVQLLVLLFKDYSNGVFDNIFATYKH
jgi:hypothetical protein